MLSLLTQSDRAQIQKVEEIRSAAWKKVQKKMESEPVKPHDTEYEAYQKTKVQSMKVMQSVYRAALERGGYHIRAERLHESDCEYHALVERNGHYFFLEADASLSAWEVDPSETILGAGSPSRLGADFDTHGRGLPQPERQQPLEAGEVN